MTLTKPEWLAIKPASTEKYAEVKKTMGELGLNSVCVEAHCPNMAECWDGGTATFMVLGDKCTRGCRFCSVKKSAAGAAIDKEEPKKLAAAVKRLNLSYVVITSVCRDDLKDQGAGHFAECITAIKKENKNTLIEVLIPDFGGNRKCLETIIAAKPEVIGHNIETVRDLTPKLRDRRASYNLSLDVLSMVKEIDPSRCTKSALMLGMGEEEGEIITSISDLAHRKVDFLALGQYLQPSAMQLPVVTYINPRQFEKLKKIGIDMGFKYVASGPFVRSSYRAGENFPSSLLKQRKAKRPVREGKAGAQE